jgi:ABC-2 type transport system ATP-binding protein
MLQIDDLHFQYRDKAILKGVSLRLDAGQACVILGGNGAGKSTLLKLILGQLSAQRGSIRFETTPAAAKPAAIAYVPELVAVYEHLSGMENLTYFLRLAGLKPPMEMLTQQLRRVGLPENAWHERSAAYSKGMRQKLVIALALARGAQLILLDEPTTGLDPSAIQTFHELLQRLRQQGVSLLMVTHDVLSASSIADQLLFLSDGQLREIERSDLFDVAKLQQLYLGHALTAA